MRDYRGGSYQGIGKLARLFSRYFQIGIDVLSDGTAVQVGLKKAHTKNALIQIGGLEAKVDEAALVQFSFGEAEGDASLQFGRSVETRGKSSGLKMGLKSYVQGTHKGIIIGLYGEQEAPKFRGGVISGVEMHITARYDSFHGIGINLYSEIDDFNGARLGLLHSSDEFNGVSVGLGDYNDEISNGLVMAVFGKANKGSGFRFVVIDRADNSARQSDDISLSYSSFKGVLLSLSSAMEQVYGVQIGAYCKASHGRFLQLGLLLDRGDDLPFLKRYRLGLSWRFDIKQPNAPQETRESITRTAPERSGLSARTIVPSQDYS